MERPHLEFNLRKSFPGFELKVEAALPPGITAVFGPTGSGKTTLLSCVAGVCSPDEGEVLLAGRTLYSSHRRVRLPPEERHVGYVFQEPLLFPHLSVRDNIYYGFSLTAQERRKVSPLQLIELLELGPLLQRRPEGL